MQSWGVRYTNNVYGMPKLYWGGILPDTDGQTSSFDFKGSLGNANAEGHPVLGILGMDVLKHLCLQLDFTAGKIRFPDAQHADKETWGKAFPIVALNAKDDRPSVAQNLFGAQGPRSLVDSGCSFDGWLMPAWFQQWTNQTMPPTKETAQAPGGMFDGEKCLFLDLVEKDVESDGTGLRFLARHLVTLDFPGRTRTSSAGPSVPCRIQSRKSQGWRHWMP